jgi:hypothetical protein
MVRLCENSRLGILSDGSLHLERGKILVLKEMSESDGKIKTFYNTPLSITTPEVSCRFTEGGFSADVSVRGSWLKVFSDRLTLQRSWRKPMFSGTWVNEEGFKYFYQPFTDGSHPKKARLSFADYRDWQLWMKKAYEKKDDFNSKLFEREMT